MDESVRDAYNRFGDAGVEFDPRKDEMKLISDMSISYVFWAVIAYTFTIPVGSRASRTWISICGICLLGLEVCFCLTETSIPQWVPSFLCEFELIFYLHTFFPLVMALMRCLADSFYVDRDETSRAVLEELSHRQEVYFPPLLSSYSFFTYILN